MRLGGSIAWRKPPVSALGKPNGQQWNSPPVRVIRVGLPMLGAAPDGPAPGGQDDQDGPRKGWPRRHRTGSSLRTYHPARPMRRSPEKKAKIGIILVLTSKGQLGKNAATSHEL